MSGTDQGITFDDQGIPMIYKKGVKGKELISQSSYALNEQVIIKRLHVQKQK